jgi:hypothetical protein
VSPTCLKFSPTDLKLLGCFQLCTAGAKNTTAPSPTTGREADGIPTDITDVVLVGLAVSWEYYDAYYISLTATTPAGKISLRLLLLA